LLLFGSSVFVLPNIRQSSWRAEVLVTLEAAKQGEDCWVGSTSHTQGQYPWIVYPQASSHAFSR